MANEVIKKHALDKGVRLWEVAEKEGITDSYFSRRLRKEFSKEETKRIRKIIDDIAKNRGKES